MLMEQLRRQSLAIISLCVALFALGYNTWRNELTEHNRNIRVAGFEMLVHIGALQRITYLAHYDQDTNAGNPRKGWVEVLVLLDLAQLVPPPTPESAAQLHKAWSSNWDELGGDEQADVEEHQRREQQQRPRRAQEDQCLHAGPGGEHGHRAGDPLI